MPAVSQQSALHALTHSGNEAATSPQRALDWTIAVTSAWLVGGFWLDAWAHIFMPRLETFFTPWHGVLYSGFLANVLTLLFAALRYRTPDQPLWRALTAGHELYAVGALILILGGLSDLVWHTTFGIERSVDAFLCPPHLVLASGGMLLISGPLRAAWLRPTVAPCSALRLFAFATPVALYLLALALTEGLSWTPSLWTGAILEADVFGLVLSYLAAPPNAGDTARA